MTRIERSDSQLNAEAAQPLEDRDLGQAIAVHRAMFAADRNWLTKLHVRDGESGLGVPFSPAFEALLEGRLGQFPYSKAMLGLRDRHCRGLHLPKHSSRDEWQGALCHTLVGLVIRLELPLPEAQRRLGLPNERQTRRTLDNALLYLERRIEDDYAAYILRETQKHRPARTPNEWMAPDHQHLPLPGLHADDCIQCLRRRAAA